VEAFDTISAYEHLQILRTRRFHFLFPSVSICLIEIVPQFLEQLALVLLLETYGTCFLFTVAVAQSVRSAPGRASFFFSPC
jgi:hypothetical protein